MIISQNVRDVSRRFCETSFPATALRFWDQFIGMDAFFWKTNLSADKPDPRSGIKGKKAGLKRGLDRLLIYMNCDWSGCRLNIFRLEHSFFLCSASRQGRHRLRVFSTSTRFYYTKLGKVMFILTCFDVISLYFNV